MNMTEVREAVRQYIRDMKKEIVDRWYYSVRDDNVLTPMPSEDIHKLMVLDEIIEHVEDDMNKASFLKLAGQDQNPEKEEGLGEEKDIEKEE